MGWTKREMLERLKLFGVAEKTVDAWRMLYMMSTSLVYRAIRYALTRILYPFREKRDARYKASNTGKKTISLLCPTRGRPKGAERLARSIQRSAAFPGRVEVLFYVDSDDEEREAYRALHESAKTRFKNLKGCVVVIGEPMSVSKSWNIIAERSTGDVLIMANDDQVYVDYGWDTRLDHEAEKYPDGVYCMWFDDGGYGADHCTFPMISRTWYKAVGYYAPGIFEFIHNDTWIWDIGKRVGREHYIPGVFIEHLHC
jgi:hypothetical protein